MESKVDYARVGSFLVALGAALMAVVLWLSKGHYGTAYDRYYTYMTESVSGLSENGPVRYRGVAVGNVKEIVLNPENPEEVRLTLEVVRGTPIKEDPLAVLDFQGLTGLAVVDLKGGSRGSPALAAKEGQAYPVIKAGPSIFFSMGEGLSHLLRDGTASRFVANANGLTEDARAVFDRENRANLKEVLGNMSKVSRSLGAQAPDIGMESRRTLREAHLLVAELRDLTGTMQRIAQKIERQPNLLILGARPQKKGPGE